MSVSLRVFGVFAVSLLAVSLLAAGFVGCGEDGTQPVEAAVGCDAKTGMERDRCLHDEIAAVPGSQPDEVLKKARLIRDPMIRGAAVSTWVAAHVSELPQDKGQELCDLLEGRDKSYCQRRLSSPHLQH
jgi:hypothetical protein